MCFDTDARPPIAPIAGGSIDSGTLTLTAADGNRLTAFRARAEDPSGAGIVILPDVRGLHAYYEDLALRFAERGVDAIAIDWFGRTAGLGRRGPEFPYADHVPRLEWDGSAADIRAAVDWLRSAEGGAPIDLFVVGFCMGGRIAFLAASLGLGLAGAIGFYGNPVGSHRSNTPPPIDSVRRSTDPILGLFGGADEGIPAAGIEAFDAALTAAGVEHRLVTYPGAPHSFFDRKFDEFATESAAAWDEILGFIRERTTAGR